MDAWAERLGTLGEVHRFDYPREAASDPDAGRVALEEAHLGALAAVRADGPLVLVGKSLGAWVGCLVAARVRPAALVALGYPLCGPGAERAERGAGLLGLPAPLLVVQGTRDPLAPRHLLDPLAGAAREIAWIDGANHSLLVDDPRRQAEADATAMQAIAAFLRVHVSG